MHCYEPVRKARFLVWVPEGGNPPQIAEKSISEDGTVCDIHQLKRNRVAKPRETIGKYYRDKVRACSAKPFLQESSTEH